MLRNNDLSLKRSIYRSCYTLKLGFGCNCKYFTSFGHFHSAAFWVFSWFWNVFRVVLIFPASVGLEVWFSGLELGLQYFFGLSNHFGLGGKIDYINKILNFKGIWNSNEKNTRNKDNCSKPRWEMMIKEKNGIFFNLLCFLPDFFSFHFLYFRTNF